jgi:hypothetical protein
MILVESIVGSNIIGSVIDFCKSAHTLLSTTDGFPRTVPGDNGDNCLMVAIVSRIV